MELPFTFHFSLFPTFLPSFLSSLNNSTDRTYLLKQTFIINNVKYKVTNLAFNFFLFSLIPICIFYIEYFLETAKPKFLRKLIKVKSVSNTFIIETSGTNNENHKQIYISKIYAEDSDFLLFG